MIAMFGLSLSMNTFADLVDDPRAADQYEVDLFVIEGEASIRAGRAHAFRILSKAYYKTTSSKNRRIFKSVHTGLGRATIKFPRSGYDFKHCISNPRVLAFVMMNKRQNIHLCANTTNNTWSKFVGQVLIHETAHTMGISNECTATKIEVAAMRTSGEGIAFKNGYWAKCGIKG